MIFALMFVVASCDSSKSNNEKKANDSIVNNDANGKDSSNKSSNNDEGSGDKSSSNSENENATIDNDTGNLVFGLLDDGKSYSVLRVNSRSITNLVIPSKYNGKPVTSIGKSAFERCTKLASIEISNSVTTIGLYAFERCSSLTSIVIPNSVVTIDSYSFEHCSSLTSIEIPDSVTIIGSYAFSQCSSLTSIKIPNSVTMIGEYAFDNCSSLKDIEISDSVTSIGKYAFRDCDRLKYNEYDNAYYLGNPDNLYLYLIKAKSSDITSCIINCKCKFLYVDSFSDCYNSLKSIEIPNTVKGIGYDAFSFCNLLQNVYYDGTMEGWCNIAFDGLTSNPMVYATNFYFMNEVGNVEYNGNNYSLLTKLIVPNTVTTINYQFTGFNNLISIEIPNSVTGIGRYAFYKCSSLTSLKIPNSVTSIGSHAFDNCSLLTSIEIPDSVTSIGGSIFFGCSSLQSIVMPFVGDKRHVNVDRRQYPLSSLLLNQYSLGYVFGTENFSGAKSTVQYYYGYNAPSVSKSTYYIPAALKEVIIKDCEYIQYGSFYNCSSLTSIEIPTSLTSIGEYAFYNCSSLTSIEIPTSLTSIGEYAFCNCSSLTSIYYKGLLSDWHNISIGSVNTPLSSATIYCYSEMEPTESGNYWHYVDGKPTAW